MQTSRRTFLAAGAAAAVLTPFGLFARQQAAQALTSMTGDVVPISRAEHLQRLARAQRLMTEQGLGALLIEPGSSMTYFSGVQWWRSERLTALVIPAIGEPCVVTPHFEEPSVRESLKIPADVRVWNEDENPHEWVAGFLRDRRITGPIGVEETVRFFAVDGLRRAMPGVEIRAGAPVVRGCRMFKSAHELALMQKASDVTMAAFRYIHPRIEAGMNPGQIEAMYVAAVRALGASTDGGLVLLGEASAYPHGSGQAAGGPSGRGGAARLRLLRRGLSVRHFADLRFRRADPCAAPGLGAGASGPADRDGCGPDRPAGRQRRRRGARAI